MVDGTIHHLQPALTNLGAILLDYFNSITLFPSHLPGRTKGEHPSRHVRPGPQVLSPVRLAQSHIHSHHHE